MKKIRQNTTPWLFGCLLGWRRWVFSMSEWKFVGSRTTAARCWPHARHYPELLISPTRAALQLSCEVGDAVPICQMRKPSPQEAKWSTRCHAVKRERSGLQTCPSFRPSTFCCFTLLSFGARWPYVLGIISAHYRMFSSAPGFYSLDASSKQPILSWQSKMSPDVANVPWGAKSLLTESYRITQYGPTLTGLRKLQAL